LSHDPAPFPGSDCLIEFALSRLPENPDPSAWANRYWAAFPCWESAGLQRFYLRKRHGAHVVVFTLGLVRIE